MSDKKTLVAKLAEACDAVGGIEKKGTNQKQNYKYVRAADVAKAFRHELFERGIVLVGDEKELIQLESIPTQSGGKLNMIGVKIEYSLLDSESTDKIVATGYGIGMDSGDKAIYKAKTGALKYFLRGLGLIPDEKDDPEADEESPTFQKQNDGSFAKNPPPKPSPETTQKPKAIRKKTEPSDYQPWAGLAGQPKQEPVQKTEPPATNGQGSPENIHGVTDIQDSEIPFPGDEKKDRLATEEERKQFVERAKALKAKGAEGIGPWLLKKGNVRTTQEIPYGQMTAFLDELEAAEKYGKLKELLNG